MIRSVSRRDFLTGGILGATALCASANGAGMFDEDNANSLTGGKSCSLDLDKIRFCLNLGSLRHYNLNLMQELEVARDAGFHSVEIWFDRLTDYARDDGSQGFSTKKLQELKRFIDGEGLKIEGGIGFAPWIVDDNNRRASGLNEIKIQAEALSFLDSHCIAAPASGIDQRISDHAKIADRYREIIDICRPFGVRPLLELWGASSTLGKLSDCLAVCAETGREDAALLLDVYHLYRGGNSFAALALISGSALPILHMNDYPAAIEREKLTDADRVFPGDGDAPWATIIQILAKNGFTGALSYEVFNRSYFEKYSAVEQAQISLEKMRRVLNWK